MIRNPWMILWICLFLLQVLSVLVHRHWAGQGDLPVFDVDPGLVELAERTTDQMLLETSNNPGQIAMASRSENLIHRESLILELQRLQEELRKNGVETQVAEDLQVFLDLPEARERITEMNAYISGILDWIKPYIPAIVCCSLQRLSLFPDSATSLPVLAFELTGTPAKMAESLLLSANEDSCWDLIELDMLIPENDNACWLRGSFAFMTTFSPQ